MRNSVCGFRKLLQERLEKAYPRRELTTEEKKRLNKLEAIANRLKRGENVQNRQLQTWHSETLCKYFPLKSLPYSRRRKNVLFILLANL